MAVLSPSDLQRLRQDAARFLPVVLDAKPIANAIFQAIEDYETGAQLSRPAGSRAAAVNAAAVRTVTAANQAIMWGAWARWKAINLGVS